MTAELEDCLSFESDPAHVRLARTFVACTLRQWEQDDFVGDAQLVASELATSAVLHARTEIRLTLRSDGRRWVRIELQDQNSRLPTQVACPEDATSGQGLAMVEALATVWGVAPEGGGKTVWAEIGARDDGVIESECTEVGDAALLS